MKQLLLILAFLTIALPSHAATDTICWHQPTNKVAPASWTLKFDGVEETATPSDQGALTWNSVAGRKWCVTYTVPSANNYVATLWANWGSAVVPAANQSLTIYKSANCRADFGDNGAVDLNDVSYVHGRMGTPCPNVCRDDLNKNGAIDLNDVSGTLDRYRSNPNSC